METNTATTYLAAICMNKAPSQIAYLHANGSMLFAVDGAVEFEHEADALEAATRVAANYYGLLDVTPGTVPQR